MEVKVRRKALKSTGESVVAVELIFTDAQVHYLRNIKIADVRALLGDVAASKLMKFTKGKK